jgi:predicted deacylase
MPATKSKSQPLPDVVRQEDLLKHFDLKRQIETLQAELAEHNGWIEAMVRDGFSVEEGPHFAQIVKKPGRKSVGWKHIVVKLKGEGYAKRVLASTKPGPGKEVLEIT